MSSSYFCYVIPDARYAAFAPSVDLVANIVHALDDGGWVYHGPSPVEIRTLGQTLGKRLAAGDTAANEVRSFWNGSDFLRLDLLPIGALSDPGPAEPAGSTGRTSPTTVTFADCWNVSLVVLPRLTLVPSDGPSGTTFTCPACSGDVWPALQTVRPVEERIYWGMPLPPDATCPHCSNLVSAAQITAITPSGSDGTLKRELCPFFRVGVALITDDPPPDPAPVDARLLSILTNATGVPFRVLARFR